LFLAETSPWMSGSDLMQQDRRVSSLSLHPEFYLQNSGRRIAGFVFGSLTKETTDKLLRA